MIVKAKNAREGLWKTEYKGDQMIMTHAEHVSPIMQRAKDVFDTSDNGWTQDRTMRQIGCIPSSILLKHPEWMQEPALLKRWLMSDEGSPYRTVRSMRTK